MTGRTRTYRRLNPKYVGDVVAEQPAAPAITVEPTRSQEDKQAAANQNLADAQSELAEARAEYYRIKAERAKKREAKKAVKDEKKAAKVARKTGN